MTLGRSPAVSEPASQASPKKASRSHEPVPLPPGFHQMVFGRPKLGGLCRCPSGEGLLMQLVYPGVERPPQLQGAGSIWPEAAQLVGTDPEEALPLAGSISGPWLGRLRCDFRDAWVSARLKWPCPSRRALGKLCKGKNGGLRPVISSAMVGLSPPPSTPQ